MPTSSQARLSGGVSVFEYIEPPCDAPERELFQAVDLHVTLGQELLEPVVFLRQPAELLGFGDGQVL